MVPTRFQGQVSLILRYFDINCSQPKLTFEHSGFCLLVEKSPEQDALYFLQLLDGERAGSCAGTKVLRILTCAGYQQL